MEYMLIIAFGIVKFLFHFFHPNILLTNMHILIMPYFTPQQLYSALGNLLCINMLRDMITYLGGGSAERKVC